MKQAFADILGNKMLKERLGRDILSSSLSHAYIIEGAKGFGKKKLALRIAAALSCENKENPSLPLPCCSCPSCKKILSGNSPDVIFVNRGDKATLGVEAVRNMHSDICIAPNDTDYKIYIIEDAHLMTVQAQNAFLLTLEEPPPYVLFFLLCETAAPLLETVKSRAPTLRMQPVDTDCLAQWLCENEVSARQLKGQSPKEFSELLTVADGSVGRALSLLDPKERKPIMEQRAAARKFAELCRNSHNSGAVFEFLNSLGQKRDELIAELSVILLCFRDLLLLKETEEVPLCFYSDREEAIETACHFSAPELLKICRCISNAADRLRMNANVRLALTELAIGSGLLS